MAPGFIDIHTHYDAQVFWDPALTPSSFHGVTTVIAGNCGFSIAPTRPEHHTVIARTLENVEDMNVETLAAGIPWDFETFPEYLASVARRGSVLNFNAYVGHTALRLFVMGDAAYERIATPEETGMMCDLLRDAMSSGAAGFATSCIRTHRGVDGKPVPSRFAELAELDALADVMADSGRGVIAVAAAAAVGQRYLYELQPRIGVPITITALLASSSGGHKPLVELERPRVGERRRGVAAGDAPAVALPVLDGVTVHPQPAGVVRRADGGRARSPARGVRVPPSGGRG